MRFSENVVRFNFAGIPMVGNLDNGYAIGLTEDGARICDRLIDEDVESQDIISVDESLFQHLQHAGFFGPAQPKQGLANAYLHVTQRCNLECLGCYSFDDQRNSAADPSLEALKHSIDEMARAGVASLIISGGEPFLRKDLAEIVAYAHKECGIASVSIITNGTCIDVGQLKQMRPYVDKISVSFDGCSADSVAYIRQEQRFLELVEAVKVIQQVGIASHLIATIHAKNIEDISAYNRLASELGVTMNFSLLSCPATSDGLGALSLGEEDLRFLGRQMLDLCKSEQMNVLDAPIGTNLSVKRKCGVGRSTISVGSDGAVYPCHMLHDSKLSMGNLFEGSIEEIIHGTLAMSLDELEVANFEDCKACDFKWVCGGGCRGRSYSSYGDLVSKDGYCSMIIEFYSGLGSQLRALYA